MNSTGLARQQFDFALRVYGHIAKLSVGDANHPVASVPLYNEIERQVERGQKLSFILPAFPAKSANREKTIDATPDYADVLGLKALNDVCEQINRFYFAGAEIIICSDGRVFNDLVMVSDEDLMKYKVGIETIIQSMKLVHLKTFSLDDCFEHQDFAQMRQDLEANYSESVESIRSRVKSNVDTRDLFNGIHRFMKEDMQVLRPDLSKNQLMEASKVVTYKVMQRSGAWDQMLSNHFPCGLRLSIHPYPITYRKFGVKLVGGADRWATPWHNVALKMQDRFFLVKRKLALEMGAVLKFAEGDYAYYQL